MLHLVYQKYNKNCNVVKYGCMLTDDRLTNGWLYQC